jgi:hypothetical protein
MCSAVAFIDEFKPVLSGNWQGGSQSRTAAAESPPPMIVVAPCRGRWLRFAGDYLTSNAERDGGA